MEYVTLTLQIQIDASCVDQFVPAYSTERAYYDMHVLIETVKFVTNDNITVSGIMLDADASKVEYVP